MNLYLTLVLILRSLSISIVDVYNEVRAKNNIAITSEKSLLYGVMCNATEGLRNFRFHSDLVTLSWCFDETEKCIKLQNPKDRAVNGNDIGRILIKLWPSPLQNFSIYTSYLGNFAKILKGSKEIRLGGVINADVDLHFLSAMLIGEKYKGQVTTTVQLASKQGDPNRPNMILLRIESNNGGTATELIRVEMPHGVNRREAHKISQIREVVEVLQLFFTQSAVPEEWFISKNLILQAYIAAYIDTADRLRVFYALYESLETVLQSHQIQCTDTVDAVFERSMMEGIAVIVEGLTSESNKLFPYNEANPPAKCMGSMSLYIRPSDKIVKHRRFSSCVENALYHVFNCMLWDLDTKGYVPLKVPKGQDEVTIDSFFSGEIKRNLNFDNENDWQKVVADIEGAQIWAEGNKDRLKFEKSSNTMYYVISEHGAKNEINAGLLNLLNSMYFIAKRKDGCTKVYEEFAPILGDAIDDHNNGKEYKKELNHEKVRDAVVNIFKDLFPHFEKSDIAVEVEDAVAMSFDNRLDIKADVIVTKKNKSGDVEVRFRIEISNGHDDFSLEKFVCTNIKPIDTTKLQELLRGTEVYQGRNLLLPCAMRVYKKCMELKDVNAQIDRIAYSDVYKGFLCEENHPNETQQTYIDFIARLFMIYINKENKTAQDHERYKYMSSNIFLMSYTILSVELRYMFSLLSQIFKDEGCFSFLYVNYAENMSGTDFFIKTLDGMLSNYLPAGVKDMYNSVMQEVLNLRVVETLATTGSGTAEEVSLAKFLHNNKAKYTIAAPNYVLDFYNEVKLLINKNFRERIVSVTEIASYMMIYEISKSMEEIMIQSQVNNDEMAAFRAFVSLYRKTALLANCYPRNTGLWVLHYKTDVPPSETDLMHGLMWTEAICFGRKDYVELLLDNGYIPCDQSLILYVVSLTLSQDGHKNYNFVITSIFKKMITCKNYDKMLGYKKFTEDFLSKLFDTFKDKIMNIIVCKALNTELFEAIDYESAVNMNIRLDFLSLECAKYVLELFFMKYYNLVGTNKVKYVNILSLVVDITVGDRREEFINLIGTQTVSDTNTMHIIKNRIENITQDCTEVMKLVNTGQMGYLKQIIETYNTLCNATTS